MRHMTAAIFPWRVTAVDVSTGSTSSTSKENLDHKMHPQGEVDFTTSANSPTSQRLLMGLSLVSASRGVEPQGDDGIEQPWSALDDKPGTDYRPTPPMDKFDEWSIALRRSKGGGDGTGTANVAICWPGEIKRIGTHIRASVRIGRLPEPVTPHIWNASRVENRFCRLCSEVQH
ncbi:hypothetical protein CABS01_12538 [Colletotrichum abscissum]|uniref:uncharacterized protein n=1 Tax=Colletotrichum abscissum TaxID=1671311 RepID=UPI0027D69E13|nr:uncharacterized protein CABS01_12538 [Colletotrichum abscissum]KAK1489957.1 hypothetical protein CABS01_12538 [Colletotrichum abscissum]